MGWFHHAVPMGDLEVLLDSSIISTVANCCHDYVLNIFTLTSHIYQEYSHSPDEENSDQPSETDSDKWRAIIKADALVTTREVAQEVNASHPVVTASEANWKGEKA
ncbi:unnamed protein product [Rangifer tarandus platyrhynchus]|uniref:Uncharacterized protein n=2 Tax=Rangifer tarandus platyrhynchus TaxID=3082113 RepID=A0ACB0FAQ4_RANTA|nr:unnamed protein product [Rangifer tarandus platyrhynchus]CAI9710155.1 unnamed protein product [Rangifer tarandus platyrhynchus]